MGSTPTMNSMFSLLLTLTANLVQVPIKVRISRDRAPTLTPAQIQTKAKARRLLIRTVTVVTVLRDLTPDLIQTRRVRPTQAPNPTNLRVKVLPQKVRATRAAKAQVLTLAPIPAPILVPSLALKETQPPAPTPVLTPRPSLKLKQRVMLKPKARTLLTKTAARASLPPSLLSKLLLRLLSRLQTRLLASLLLVARAASPQLEARASQLLKANLLEASPLEAKDPKMRPKR